VSAGVDFVKMSGAGNDFIVLDAEQSRAIRGDLAPWIRRVCRRGVSVGADGVLFVEAAGAGRVRVTFRNPDASEAFCGNGSRCAARFAHLRGFVGPRMVLETIAGDVEARIEGKLVEVLLPAPEDRGPASVEVAGERLEGRFVIAGSPHFVVLGSGFPEGALAAWGPAVRRAEPFGAAGVNFDLAVPLGPSRLSVRTWERGVEGETLSCGSGAVAAAFAALRAGGARATTVVPASGIALAVEFAGDAQPTHALLRGDARYLFEGRLSAEAAEDPSGA